MPSCKRSRRSFLQFTLGSPLLFAAGCSTPTSLSGSRSKPRDLTELLAAVRDKSGLPAIAAAAMKKGEVVALGAVGVRKVGNPTPVTVSDRFHIGSCTKAMTSTLAAMLVEEGKLSWNRTLAETFPERVERMHRDYLNVTLELLLTHRSGAPPNGSFYGLPFIPVTLQRLAYMDAVVSTSPEKAPGTTFNYSNAGYIIAGAMLERVARQSWEELIQERLFDPLRMSSAGFGAPSKPNQIDQPWGHTLKDDKYEPRHGDNPPALGPAGTVHCTVTDYLKFAELHASGGAHPKRLLNSASVARLQEPPPHMTYAFGWGVTERKWAEGTALTHHGSNTMNYFIVWIAPKIELCLAVATNAAGDKVAEVLDTVASPLVREFGSPS